MKSVLPALAAIALLVLPPLAHAVATEVSASGYLVTHKATVKTPPRQLQAAFAQVAKWWNPQHTYSGNAGHLSLDLRAGGCFCERWDGNSIEHARVIYVARDKVLRLEGALGPLQEMAVTGIMNFALAAKDDATELTLTYRVRGSAEAALDKTAGVVDQVLAEQLQRLVRFVETGSAVPVAAPAPLEDRFFTHAGLKLRYLDEGKGADPVLLLHDAGSGIEAQWIDTGLFAGFVKQDIFRVVALDLRGHGRSEKPASQLTGAELAADVLALLAHLQLPRAHLVGYGLGANLAAYIAVRHPDKVITVTLAGGAHATSRAAAEPQRGLAVTDDELKSMAAPTFGIAGTRDPAMGELLAIKRFTPRLVRMVTLDQETHASAPRHEDFLNSILYFLRYHPARLVK